MTVTYQTEVASIRSFGVFWKLLFRWKGSIYKLVWPDLSLYIILYFTLNMSYRFAMNEHHRQLFEEVSRYCANFSTFIPMSFVLGFYVTIVVNRWWEQYMAMPWPDPLAVFVSTNIQGNDDRGRLIRRTIMRYVNLSFVYTMSQVCTRVKMRFPTLEHLVEAGIMTDTEKKIFELMNKKTPHLKYWMPLVWAGSIVTKARKEGRIRDDFAVKTLVDSINTFRSGLGNVLNYDWISVPLVYTQTVTLAVYTFFIAELMGRQFVKGNEPEHQTIDLYVPIFTFLQFFFYMGWLRVAETLFNPFGDDDDDFEINWMIDRNLQVSYIIVDEMHEDHPELVRDQYWEDVIPADLPYTVAAEQYRREPPQGSAAQIDVKRTEMMVSDGPPAIPEEDETRILVAPKDLESAQSSLIPEGRRLPASSAIDIGMGAVSPGAGGDPASPAATVSADSRLSGPLQTASIKRSVRGLMNKLSNRVKDTPSNMLVTRSSSRASNDSRKTNPPHSPAGRGEDEVFVMSDLDLAADSRGSLPLEPGGEPPPPPPGRPASVTSSEEPLSVSQRRHSTSSEGSEERTVPKFLPGDYNFMIPTVPEEDESEPEDAPSAEPPAPQPQAVSSVQLANMLSTTFHPSADEAVGEELQQPAAQQNLLTQLITTIIEAAGGTVQPRPPMPSPPPSPTQPASPVLSPTAGAPPRHVQFAAKSGDSARTAGADRQKAAPGADSTSAPLGSSSSDGSDSENGDRRGEEEVEGAAAVAEEVGVTQGVSEPPPVIVPVWETSDRSGRDPASGTAAGSALRPGAVSGTGSADTASTESTEDADGRPSEAGTTPATPETASPDSGQAAERPESETEDRRPAGPGTAESGRGGGIPPPGGGESGAPRRHAEPPQVSAVGPAAERTAPPRPPTGSADRAEVTEEGDSLADDSSVAPLLPDARHRRRRHDTDSSDEPDASETRQTPPPPTGDGGSTPFY